MALAGCLRELGAGWGSTITDRITSSGGELQKQITSLTSTVAQWHKDFREEVARDRKDVRGSVKVLEEAAAKLCDTSANADGAMTKLKEAADAQQVAAVAQAEAFQAMKDFFEGQRNATFIGPIHQVPPPTVAAVPELVHGVRADDDAHETPAAAPPGSVTTFLAARQNEMTHQLQLASTATVPVASGSATQVVSVLTVENACTAFASLRFAHLCL